MAEVFEVALGQPQGRFAGQVCTIGVFDGVHEGHRWLIGEALGDARQRGECCIVITFASDPDERFGGSGFRKIMGNGERIAALARSGADAVAVLPFDEALAALAPDAFLDAVFAQGAPAAIHVGSDFRFGRAAAGAAADLAAWGRAHGCAVHAHDLLERAGARISSTRVRSMLAAGDVRAAAALLGHPYEIAGIVRHGREAGREMGIRTANLEIPADALALADGVYAAYAIVGGERYRAAVSVGIPPTFEDEARANVEAHILDFNGDLYGQAIALQFIERLRPMQRFERTADLIAAIEGDIAWVQQNL